MENKPLPFNKWFKPYYTSITAIAEKYAKYVDSFKNK